MKVIERNMDMSADDKLCQGRFDFMRSCSNAAYAGFLSKRLSRLRNTWGHAMWHLDNKGLRATVKLAIFKLKKLFIPQGAKAENFSEKEKLSANAEVLNLKAGELVEIKSEEEILATLGGNQKNKGLLWMAGMRKFCGKRYRVFKRLETILLESSGEVRKMKNTVLLEGVMCDGREFYGCGRSCFHFWREAWLKRVG